jgi:antitoxin component YwqK of YwqJK toxin-antitoxin module
MRLFFLFLLLSFSKSFTQCISYRLNDKGDTLNCKDKNNLKQGKWSIHVEQLRGEPGFEEEGIFINDKKEGKWRRYNLMGDLTAVENYKWGNKNGTQQYFYLNALEHEESWLAIDPKKQYDTIEVPDLYDPYKVEKKIIKVNAYALRNGVWKYYKPGSMSLIKTETYVFDSLYVPIPEKSNTVATIDKPVADSVPKKATPNKTKEVLEYEKKNSKKKTKVRDGATGY